MREFASVFINTSIQALVTIPHKGATDRTVPMRGIVTKTHKYVRYLEDGEELYDLQEDALETKNLIGDEQSRQVAEEMRRKLNVWLARTRDDQTLP